MMTKFTAFVFVLIFIPFVAYAGSKVKLNGYAEWRVKDAIIVDGQRVRSNRYTKYKVSRAARNLDSIPLGYEIKVMGSRQKDGSVLAKEIEAKPNGNALFENDLKQAFDQMEAEYRQKGRMFTPQSDGTVVDIGELQYSGVDVERVRRIMDRLIPPYLKREDYRVYVVQNKEWNAMAAPNGSIYVFSGLLKDMDDDEVAVVLGHELVHATHEHSRKQYKNSILIQMAAIGSLGLSGQATESSKTKSILAIATALGVSAWSNGYSRDHEDQADRVGLRYAYEGGFAVQKGPMLWARFAQKYGDQNKVVNFFLGNHSVAKDRQRNLEMEIQLNYPSAISK
jgi:Zn-dependent protease with chaperone function